MEKVRNLVISLTLLADLSIDNARYVNVKLGDLQGEIYGLCKDQHGCRYLQKKLEERNQEHVQLIFLETKQHVVELMTGIILIFFIESVTC